MRQTQLQSGPLGGGMQHLDCGIGDFGPNPIAGQHADLELSLIRHPFSSALCRYNAAQRALEIFLAMIHPGVALEYRARTFRTTACGTVGAIIITTGMSADLSKMFGTRGARELERSSLKFDRYLHRCPAPDWLSETSHLSLACA
jgi:hypothetical protein